ncbi:MAG: PP0621 family protein [Burkholderiales bacterium]
MGRVLILVLLIVVGAWLVRRALRRMHGTEANTVEKSASADELVRCAHCGVLLPSAEGRESAGARYCSDEHARLGPTGRPGAR